MLLRGLGLIAAPAELAPEQLADLMTSAMAFLRAGGRISIEEWQLLLPVEREALAEAGDAVRTQYAARIALAVRGPEAAAEIVAPIDGGDSAAHAMCSAFAEAAAIRLSGERTRK